MRDPNDPFNCPECGAHDFGLTGPFCVHCMKSALEEVIAGWHDIDPRIRYVEVQIDKDELKRIHRLLGRPEPTFDK